MECEEFIWLDIPETFYSYAVFCAIDHRNL